MLIIVFIIRNMSILPKPHHAIFAKADIKINGERDWDIIVNNPKLWQRILLHGTLGLGEAYMEGWFEVRKLDEFFYHLARFGVGRGYQSKSPYGITLKTINHLFNSQTIKHAFRVGEQHYNIGNDLYSLMLGETMAYTCGYWKNANSLDEAQINKFRLIADKLQLKSGMRVLDIGCGFGTTMAYLAREFGVEVVGVTISTEQARYINDNFKDLPIKAICQDYRHIVDGDFDRIYSIGMFEHVGYKNYPDYMQVCRRLLRPDGLMLLHTIGNDISVKSGNDWVIKYIFPNSMIPSLTQICSSIEHLFIVEDVQNFGAYYDQTLMAWHANFTKNWQNLSNQYDETFYRMWCYYLLFFAGVFRARYLQLFQIVLSPNGIKGGYNAPR